MSEEQEKYIEYQVNLLNRLAELEEARQHDAGWKGIANDRMDSLRKRLDELEDKIESPGSSLDGLRYCLTLISNVKQRYSAQGYTQYDLPLEKVIADIENEIGIRGFKEWRPR